MYEMITFTVCEKLYVHHILHIFLVKYIDIEHKDFFSFIHKTSLSVVNRLRDRDKVAKQPLWTTNISVGNSRMAEGDMWWKQFS